MIEPVVPLDFLVAGISKCGTTTLCSMLQAHTQVHIPAIKEPNFFIKEDYEQHWPWYQSLFPPAQPGVLLGEGSTFYSSWEFEAVSRQRILALYPDIKLIFIVRDPIDRIESSYREFHHSGPNFGLDCPFALTDALAMFPSMLQDSLYGDRIANYSAHIAPENLHIVFLEELYAEPDAVMERCLAFLGLPMQSISLRQDNAGPGKYYDTRLLRRMRNTPIIGPALSKISPEDQQRYFSRLLLRRAFRGRPDWGRSIESIPALQEVQQQARALLSQAGKSEALWPRVAALK